MNPIRILRWEGMGFLLALCVLVVYRLLTRQINLSGLLMRKTEGNEVSPERVQLLVATLALSAKYLLEVTHNTSGSLPDIDRNWLSVFGGSSGLYASVKAWTTFKSNQASGG